MIFQRNIVAESRVLLKHIPNFKHSNEKKVYFIEKLFISKLDINFITNK